MKICICIPSRGRYNYVNRLLTSAFRNVKNDKNIIVKYYINEDDKQLISNYFDNYQIYTIANSGHWIHAEQPELFYNSVISFIN